MEFEFSGSTYGHIIGFCLRAAKNSAPDYPEIVIEPSYDFGDFCWVARIDDFILCRSNDKKKIEKFVVCVNQAISGMLDEEDDYYV